MCTLTFVVVVGALTANTAAGEANRLTYLDGTDPYYVDRDFARLVTPQWVGEDGVDAVVVLSIDDMRGHEKWEAYLRPILDRLKQIDGRAPVSIMTCEVPPDEPHLQKWLTEGLSLEVHTVDHPCPLLKDGDFSKARSTYERCVDLMTSIDGNHPVAFRTPCCDSLNTLSPRFLTEIFNRRTAAGNFLAIDSSVFNVLTPNDPAIPRELVQDSGGDSRFRKYLPFSSFVNTIEDYPYPYVIGGNCWELPCAVPSDWEAQNVQRPNNPQTVADLSRNIAATVAKQGIFVFVFHPHGWIRNDQVVELIDQVTRNHGRKVKFLNFAEVHDRLNRNLLAGHPIRAADGGPNGVRLLDVNDDGYQDVVIANDALRQTRVWDPQTNRFQTTTFPVSLTRPAAARFGVLHDHARASVVTSDDGRFRGWTFDDGDWHSEPMINQAITRDGRDLRLLDVDGDGICELLAARAASPGETAEIGVFRFHEKDKKWVDTRLHLPGQATFVAPPGHDTGLRFVDLDRDGRLDVLVSDERRFGAYLFRGWQHGWDLVLREGDRAADDAIPMIARAGTNNGAWIHSGHLWVQNEDTARLPDLVDRMPLEDLLDDVEPTARSPEASARALYVRPGLRAELVVAEPLVMDPVAIDWGADGRLWVAEMADYPNDAEGASPGRVRYLEDTDGDGRYDRSTVFLDDIPTPNGVMTWREGVLVSAAPDILYAADTDGDGRADHRETILTGFGEGNPQHRVNGFRWGLDNWVYAANGDSGGNVTSTQTGVSLRLGPRDLRFRPHDGALEAVPGQTPIPAGPRRLGELVRKQ